MAAAIDVADEARLGPDSQLAQQCDHRLLGDQLRNKAAVPPLNGTGRPYCELGRAHACSTRPVRDAISTSRTPSIDFASTVARSVVRCAFHSSYQFTALPSGKMTSPSIRSSAARATSAMPKTRERTSRSELGDR